MDLIDTLEEKIKRMADDLQAVCASYGLANQAAEELIITNLFLYKFLNDRCMTNLNRMTADKDDLILKMDCEQMECFCKRHPEELFFGYEDTIQSLLEHLMEDEFADRVQRALVHVSEAAKKKGWQIVSAGGNKDMLFDDIVNIIPKEQRNSFMGQVIETISVETLDFDEIKTSGYAFDGYSSIFEHLISKYNVASGVYAEYYTPHAAAKMIGRCLAGMGTMSKEVEIYDPAAGTGTLLLQLANELQKKDVDPMVYAQDISVKSSRMLRMNMIFNGMMGHLKRVVQADTLLNPGFYEKEADESGDLKRFDYIVANPPFKIDFSSVRDWISNQWSETERFFAGIPKVPAKKKSGMAAYVMFLQHVLYSLKPDGKAAVVVPSGFLTAKMGIEKRIREHLIDQKLLSGAILMPSYLFSNTGTNVAVIFIDKSQESEDVVLIDASGMGEMIKVSGHKRRILSNQEEETIVEAFTFKKQVKDFSVVVPYPKISENAYIFSAGRYFEWHDEPAHVDCEALLDKIDGHQKRLEALFSEGHQLENDIKRLFKELRDE